MENFESRARELLSACADLLSKSNCALEETVYYDGVENDGSCLMDDILSLLESEIWFEQLIMI